MKVIDFLLSLFSLHARDQDSDLSAAQMMQENAVSIVNKTYHHKFVKIIALFSKENFNNNFVLMSC